MDGIRRSLDVLAGMERNEVTRPAFEEVERILSEIQERLMARRWI